MISVESIGKGLHLKVKDRRNSCKRGNSQLGLAVVPDKRRPAISSQVFARLVQFSAWADGVEGKLLPLIVPQVGFH